MIYKPFELIAAVVGDNKTLDELLEHLKTGCKNSFKYTGTDAVGLF